MLEKNIKKLIETLDSKTLVDSDHNEIAKLLKLASFNRVTYSFLNKMDEKIILRNTNLKEILEKGKRKYAIAAKTNKLIKKTSRDLKYEIVKTHNLTKYFGSDIDILFKSRNDYNIFIDRLRKVGFDFSEDDVYKSSLTLEGYQKIEPHIYITWNSQKYLDKSIIFTPKNSTKYKSAKLLIIAAHIIFDQNYLNINDYLYLSKNYHNNVVMKGARIQTKKYGWLEAFNYVINLIEKIVYSDQIYTLPYWIPIDKVIYYQLQKYYYDKSKKIKHNRNIKYLIKVIVYYYWKKIRSSLSNEPYRHSWLY